MIDSFMEALCTLAVKLTAVDGEIHEQERAEIVEYFVGTWGYDEAFVNVAVDMVHECDYTFDDLVRNLVEYTQSNPDCDAKAISRNVLAFLNEVAEANNGIGESERDTLLEAEKAFTQDTNGSATVAARVMRRFGRRESTRG